MEGFKPKVETQKPAENTEQFEQNVHETVVSLNEQIIKLELLLPDPEVQKTIDNLNARLSEVLQRSTEKNLEKASFSNAEEGLTDKHVINEDDFL